jgi:hypothetical protein
MAIHGHHGLLFGYIPPSPPTWISSSQFFLNTGTGSYSWPTHAAGDLGVMVIGTRNQAIGAISGWTFYGSVGTGTPGAAAAIMLSVYTRIATSNSQPNASVPDSGAITGGAIMVFRGCNTTTPIEASASTTGTTSSVSIPAATSLGDNRIVVHALADNYDANGGRLSAWTNASLSSLTERLDVGSSGGIGGGLGAVVGGLASAGSTGSATATHASAGAGYAAMTLVLAP